MQTFTPTKRAEFFDCLRETCNVTLAARKVGISRMRVYQVREAEPDFAKLWDDALQEGLDLLEEEVQRRAFRGMNEPVFYQGYECGQVRKYSDTLAIFYLKAHRPDKYRENSKVELSGRLELATLTDSDLENEIAMLAAQIAQGAAPEHPAVPDPVDDCTDLV